VCENHEKMWCGAAMWVWISHYTWHEESAKLDDIWDKTTTDFLNFLYQWIEKKSSIDYVVIRYELWRSTMMIWRQVNKKDKCWVYKNRQERKTTDEEIEKTT
jgi:hypothetical protein